MAVSPFPQNLFHEGTAAPLALSTAMAVPPSGDIDIIVDGDASQQGWQPIPSGQKMVITVGRGTQYESKYLVSTIDSGSVTSTLHVVEADRDYDGTQPTLAPAGTLVEHTISATEMATVNDHMRTKQTHGASGELVDTESTQTLKNKTLVDPVGTAGPFVDTQSPQTLSNKTFTNIGLPGARLIPVGGIMLWSAAAVPSGWLVCDGSTFNAATYPLLNTVLGGNTLPNLVDSYVKGGATPNLSPTGANQTVISEANMPAHSHGATATGTAGNQSADHAHHFAGDTWGGGGHSHTLMGDQQVPTNGGGRRITGGSGGVFDSTAAVGDHAHHFDAWTDGVNANHTHTISVSVTVGSKGGGTAFVNEPKHVVLRYIICAAEQTV